MSHFDVSITYPHQIVPGVWIDLEVTLTCEPDESVVCTDWWISGVAVRGSSTPGGSLSEIDLKRNGPLAIAIAEWANRHETARIDRAWRDWLNDRPVRRQA